jgi:branched-chain amino acid transport system permease protein
VHSSLFIAICAAVAAAVFAAARMVGNDYAFFAGYVVLQYIVLATAWNILGGYTGYVNFGSAAFFALGAYSTVALHKFDPSKPIEICAQFSLLFDTINIDWGCFNLDVSFLVPLFPLPIPALIVVGAVVSGIVGLGMGYLTLRLRGAFFAIATLALAVVLQTLIVNWAYVGGARGAYVIRPASVPLIGDYIQYLFLLMLALAVIAIVTARTIERSRLGYGFATIRDDELAAEASGVPTLRLKLIATTISGALMGMAGAPFPYYIGYLQPSSAFALDYAVNSIAMPMIGGTTSWVGPLIGAVLLGSLQQVATVTISSSVNLLIVGLLIIDCVIIAPKGILGFIQERRGSGSVVADPAVFGLLYILNTAPIYFLHEQGTGARSLELIFWAILIYVMRERGRLSGVSWLVGLPVLAAIFNGAILSVLSTLSLIPGLDALAGFRDALGDLVSGLPAMAYLPHASLALNVLALGCGLLCKPAPARVVTAGSGPP